MGETATIGRVDLNILTSVTQLLRYIAENTDVSVREETQTNIILENFSKTFSEKWENYTISFDNFSKKFVSNFELFFVNFNKNFSKTFSKNIDNNLIFFENVLRNTMETITDILTEFFKNQKPLDVSVGNFDVGFLSNLVDFTNLLLIDISFDLKKIYNLLMLKESEKLKPTQQIQPSITQIPEQVSTKIISDEAKILDLINLSKILNVSLTEVNTNLTNFKKILTEKFVDKFNNFVLIYERFISDVNTKRLNFLKITLLSFSSIIRIVSELISASASAFSNLTKSIWLLTLSLLAPPFHLGFIFLIGMIKTLRFTLTSVSKGTTLAMELRAVGLNLLFMVSAIYLMGAVGFGNAFKLLLFLFAFKSIIWLFQKDNIAKVTGTIKKSANGTFTGVGGAIFGLAAGITLLILAIGLSEHIQWNNVWNILAFVGGLVVILTLGARLQGGKGEKSSSLFWLSVGISLLVFSLQYASLIHWQSAIFMLGFLTGLVILVNNIGDWKNIGKVATLSTVIILLSAALFAFSFSFITEKQALINIGVLTAFIGLTYLVGLKSKEIDKGNKTLLFAAANLLLVSISLFILSSFNINWANFGALLGAIGFMVLMTWLVSKISFQSAIGAVTIAALGVTMYLTAISLEKISEMKIDFGKLMAFVGALSIMTVTILLISLIAIPALIGSTIILLLAGSTYLIGLALTSLNNLEFEGIKTFTEGIKLLCLSYWNVFPYIIPALISSVLLIPIALATLLIAGSLLLISEITIEKKNINKFNYGLEKIIETYNSFSLGAIAKSALKSLALLPIFTTTFLAALVLQKISKIEITPKQMDNFTFVLDTFVTKISKSIMNNVDNLKNAKPGLKALSKLINVSAQLVDLISAFANMTYNEYGVDENGNLKVIKVHKITPKDIENVGTGVGIMLKALLNPLNIISSDSDEWIFGTIKIKNPFKGGWFGSDDNSGAKRIERIGNAYLPISQIIKNITGSFIYDNKLVKSIGENLIQFVNDSVIGFKLLNEVGEKNIKKGISNFVDFYEDIEKINIQKIEVFAKASKEIFSVFRDEANNIKLSTLTYTKENISSIVNSVNSINLDKALALERNLKLLTKNSRNNTLLQILEKLTKLIELLNNTDLNLNLQTSNQSVATTQPNSNNISNQSNSSNNTSNTTNVVNSENIGQKLDDLISVISGTLNVNVMELPTNNLL